MPRQARSRAGHTTALGNVVHVDAALPLDGNSNIRDVQLLVETKRAF